MIVRLREMVQKFMWVPCLACLALFVLSVHVDQSARSLLFSNHHVRWVSHSPFPSSSPLLSLHTQEHTARLRTRRSCDPRLAWHWTVVQRSIGRAQPPTTKTSTIRHHPPPSSSLPRRAPPVAFAATLCPTLCTSERDSRARETARPCL